MLTKDALPRSRYSIELPLAFRNEREILIFERRTFATNPQQATLRIPLLETAASDKPHCGSIVIISPRNHLIF
jgi:hypothetical protein